MSKPEWFVIPDIFSFTDKARMIVFQNFGDWDSAKTDIDILIDEMADSDREELERVLSYDESLIIIKEHIKKEKNKNTHETRYVLNDKIFMDIINNLNDRMVSNILSGLVQKGLVESAFDSESNDFVFWIKEDVQKEKPETD